MNKLQLKLDSSPIERKSIKLKLSSVFGFQPERGKFSRTLVHLWLLELPLEQCEFGSNCQILLAHIGCHLRSEVVIRSFSGATRT